MCLFHSSRPSQWRVSALLVGLLLWLGTAGAGADTIPYRTYSTFDGLPHESITALAQSPDGRLWIGTPGGLAVYDGRRMTRVPFPDSLGRGRVGDLQAMPDGTVWVVLSGKGLVPLRHARPDGRRPSLLRPSIHAVVARGDTVIAASSDALWMLAPGASRFRRHPLPYDVQPPSMLENHPKSGVGIYDVDAGPDGTLWILDPRFGPARVSAEGEVTFAGLPTAPDNLWTRIAVAADGRVLLTRQSSNELRAYDPATGSQRVLLTDLVAPNYVFCAGSTAYITDARGFRRLDLRTDAPLPPLDADLGLPDHLPTTVLEDRAGTLWIGTRRNELMQLHAPSIRHVPRLRGVEPAFPNQFMTGIEGELWVHTYGTGLMQLRPQRRQILPDGLRPWGQGVKSDDGRIHALSRPGGWYRRAPSGSWERVGPARGALRGYVDSTGTGFFWHADGVFRHDPASAASPEVLLRWPAEERSYHQIALSPDGRLFVRAHGALLHVEVSPAEPVRIDTLATFPEAADGRGRYMTATRSGEVWMAFANRGLLHVPTGRGASPPHLHHAGEPFRNVRVHADTLLLAGARSGLYLLDARTGTTLRSLTGRDGLFNTYVKDAAVHGDSVYTSHPSGFTVLPLDAALHVPSSAPATVITDARVRGTSTSTLDTLSLAASERTLDVAYAAPYLPNPRRVTFEYRLLPIDTTWQATDRTTRQFAALGPGQHVFEVRARLEDATGPADRLVVTVAPFAYETWWFWLLAGAVLLGVVATAFWWRARRHRRNEATLQRIVGERTRELRAEKQKTEAQAARLAELDEAKNRFFANLSHEFRTPLTLITGPLQDLLRDGQEALPPRVTADLERMLRNSQRLQSLIDQLLDLTKLTAGRMELQRQPVDLVAFTRRIHEAFVPYAEREGLRLIFRPDLDTLSTSADPDKLEQILGNLLSNAIKFTPSGGTVWLTVTRETEPDGEVAHLVVKDTGPGIPEADLQRIFDRFEQSRPRPDSAPGPREGTGLGLALTRELAELHGGSIGVESEEDVGSAFTVRLPLTPTPAPTDEPPVPSMPDLPAVPADGPEATSPSPPPNAPHILVAEDNPEVRAYLRRHLSGTYHVSEAASGDAALEQVRDTPSDLVLSDVRMPGLDGFELCRAIKTEEDFRTIPVLLLTARADVEDTIEGLEHGADDYLTKPFDMRELKHRIERLLETRRTLRDEYKQTVYVEQADLHVADAEADFMEAVLSAIETSIGDPHYTVDALADDVALSRRQLTRRLRACADESPAAFIRRVRLERAATLLADEDARSVAEVAYAVGFRSPSHFATAFRKQFGCPPSRYPEE